MDRWAERMDSADTADIRWRMNNDDQRTEAGNEMPHIHRMDGFGGRRPADRMDARRERLPDRKHQDHPREHAGVYRIRAGRGTGRGKQINNAL